MVVLIQEDASNFPASRYVGAPAVVCDCDFVTCCKTFVSNISSCCWTWPLWQDNGEMLEDADDRAGDGNKKSEFDPNTLGETSPLSVSALTLTDTESAR